MTTSYTFQVVLTSQARNHVSPTPMLPHMIPIPSKIFVQHIRPRRRNQAPSYFIRDTLCFVILLSLDLLRASFSSSILIQMYTNIYKWIYHFRQHSQGNTSNTPKGSHIGPILRNVPISPEEGKIGGYTAEEACDPSVCFFFMLEVG